MTSMTDPTYGAVALLVDRSGSMDEIRDAAQSAINEFVASQAGTGRRVTVRLDEFDSEFTNVYPSTDAGQCPPYELQPRGMTALHDAMGRSITEFGQELAALPEDQRPSGVVFAVLTDGYENSSREWTLRQVKELVTGQQTQWKWDFVFLGANQDAILTATGLGIAPESALTYNTSRAGTRSAVESVARYTASSLAGGQALFTAEDRDEALEED